MRINIRQLLVVVLALAPCLSEAAWTLRYDGPDTVTLISRPNGAATNVRTARSEKRDLARQALALMLAPVFETALAHCDMADVDEIVVTPANVPDRLGDTTTHIQGMGLYVSLPIADRVSSGTWFIAPYMTLQVQLMKGGQAIETSGTLFEYTQWYVSREQEMSDDQFFRIKTEAVEDSIYKFAKERLPATMKTAFPKRCK